MGGVRVQEAVVCERASRLRPALGPSSRMLRRYGA